MSSILPATSQIITQLEDLPVTELTTVALAALHILDERGLHAAISYHPLCANLYKAKAQHFAKAIYNHDSPTIFLRTTPENEQTVLHLTPTETTL